jgi:hypothetical protein
MEGNGGSPTIEIGLDATDYYNKMTGAQATFFLIVTSKGGTGSIDSFALMDYSNDSVAAEIPCSRKNVAIAAGTTTLSINYTRPAVAAVKGLSLARDANDRIRIRGMSVFMPYKGKNTMVVTDMQGRTLKSFQTDGPGWYSLQGKIPKGTYVVSVQHRANAAVTGAFK